MKLALRILGVIVLLIGAFIVFILVSWKVDVSSEYPISELTVEADSTMLANGRALTFGPAHCSHCHLSIDQMEQADQGNVVLKGGFEFTLPIGVFRSPNITPDKETGIGRYTDGELYRMLRHNVLPTGQPTIDLMPFTTMSEYDIHSIIGYLRTLEPVRNEVKRTELNFLGKALFRFAIRPVPPAEPPAQKIEKDSSVLYGKYLAESVANCRGCHTLRDLRTGEYIGPFYAGGFIFEPSPETQGWTFTAPNLTSSTSGVMNGWNEQTFINRFKVIGRVHKYTPMPWGAFKQMSETDLKAIYRFLRSLEPVENLVNPTAAPPAPTE